MQPKAITIYNIFISSSPVSDVCMVVLWTIKEPKGGNTVKAMQWEKYASTLYALEPERRWFGFRFYIWLLTLYSTVPSAVFLLFLYLVGYFNLSITTHLKGICKYLCSFLIGPFGEANEELTTCRRNQRQEPTMQLLNMWQTWSVGGWWRTKRPECLVGLRQLTELSDGLLMELPQSPDKMSCQPGPCQQEMFLALPCETHFSWEEQ